MRLILFACSNLGKCGTFWKNGRFSGGIWPDWGNTAWGDMAGLGSKGLGLLLKMILLFTFFHGYRYE